MVMIQNQAQQLTKDQQDRSTIIVAASGLAMADGRSQDPLKVQVRLRNGEMVFAKDLPAIDRDDPQPNGDYQLALVADHDGEVKSQVGAAWIFVEDETLYALTTYSDNTLGNELWPLADGGLLQFSTEGFVEEIGDDGKYGNFWVTELAPVTTGNDPGTQVLNDGRIRIMNAFRSQSKGENMATKPVEKKKVEKTKNEVTPEERDSIIEEAVAEAKAEILAELQPVENDTDDTQEESEEEVTTEEETTDETTEEEGEEVANKKKNKISTTPKATVTNLVPKQPVIKVKNGLGTDGALVAYSNAIAQALRDQSGKAGVRAAMNAYKQKNAITGDAIIPEQIVATFFKAWLDNENLAAFRFMNSRAGAVYAFETDDTAKGHRKTTPATEKTSQTLDTIRRDLKALALYKKLTIDQLDIFDDESGQLITFRAQELSARINNQILVAALLGGTEEGSVGSTAGAGVRGLFGIVPDALAGSGFGAAVASNVVGTPGEDAYSAVVRTVGSIVLTTGGNVTSAGRSSSGITLFVPWVPGGGSWITQLLLTTNEQGQYLFPAGSNLEALLRINRIVEVPELAESGRIVAVADGAYQLYGQNNPSMYPFFDTETNQDTLLAEQFIAGSLAGYKQAAVYSPSES